jgi:hypothetical protein
MNAEDLSARLIFAFLYPAQVLRDPMIIQPRLAQQQSALIRVYPR